MIEYASDPVRVGNVIIGGGNPIVVQTMCNTHTSDVGASFKQCMRLFQAGAQMIRLTVPSMAQVAHISEIRRRLREAGCDVPIVADVHFSSDIAIAVASEVDKVRINPGNFSKNFETAQFRFAELVRVCKTYGTAIRIGVNHGSLGERITELYGNTAEGMKEAAMEWLRMCRENDFHNVVVSLKASNTCVMVEAYRLLVVAMIAEDMHYPIHLGVTEAGNGDAGRIKSLVGISALLSQGIGDTVRVSLTEDPEAELSLPDTFQSVIPEGCTLLCPDFPSLTEDARLWLSMMLLHAKGWFMISAAISERCCWTRSWIQSR